jgi:acyl-CoA synthetase (AMP-forming)/AMP-acid ligase II
VATTELPPASNIFDYVRHWETTTPERVAIGDGERSWTWREWADCIRRAAGAQASFGLLPGDRVAFLDKNNPACLETSLACGLAGTVNAIVNFRLAPEEIAWIINDSGARVLFAGAELAGMVAKISDQLHAVRRVVVVGAGGDYEQWLAGASPEEPAHQASPDDCLMQMYTSGTTGFPKGAMLTHRSMIAHVRAGVPVFGFDADSVALVAMPLFHVSGTTWALQCMAVGGQTIVLRDIVPADVLDQQKHPTSPGRSSGSSRPATQPARRTRTTAAPSSSASPPQAWQHRTASARRAPAACRPPSRTGPRRSCTSSPPCCTAWSMTSSPTPPPKNPNSQSADHQHPRSQARTCRPGALPARLAWAVPGV